MTGDLMRTLRSRKAPRQGKRARKRQAPERGAAMKAALRSALEGAVISAADRAAEEAGQPVAHRYRRVGDGRRPPTQARASGHQADWLFASVFGDGPMPPRAELNLAKSAPDLPLRAARAISAWQDHVMRLVQLADQQKRSLTRSTPLDDDTLALIAVLADSGRERDRSATRPRPRTTATS